MGGRSWKGGWGWGGVLHCKRDQKVAQLTKFLLLETLSQSAEVGDYQSNNDVRYHYYHHHHFEGDGGQVFVLLNFS